MLKLGRLYFTNRGFDLLPSLGKHSCLFTWNKFMKQLAILITSSTPSLKKDCTDFKPLVLAKLVYFHRF